MGQKNEHILAVNTDDAWRQGWGFLARGRTILAASGVDVAAFAGTWHFINWAAAVAVLGVGAGAVLALLVFRHFRIQMANVGFRLRGACNVLRQECASIQEAIAARDETKYSERYREFHPKAANVIADLFKDLVAEKRVECAIRLLMSDNNAKLVYRTAGRSSGMDKSRQNLSKDIPVDAGVAQHLRNKGLLGVCFIRDIREAIERGWWIPTNTDDLPDVRTLMIAAITTGEAEPADMIGILYITSPANSFRPWHANFTRAYAENLGLLYPVITGTWRNNNEGTEASHVQA